MTSRNTRVIEELKKTIGKEEFATDASHSYSEVMIDGHTYGTLSDLADRPPMDVSPETFTVNTVIKMFEQSTERSTREFAPIIRALFNEHKNNSDDIHKTALYVIAKDCEEKSFRTQTGSVERELLLIATQNRIESAYCE